jgi:hypothetical protein
LLAIKHSKLKEAKEIIAAWDSCFQLISSSSSSNSKVLSLAEVQRIILWYTECSNLPKDLKISDNDLLKKWEDLLLRINTESASKNLWDVALGIINLEIFRKSFTNTSQSLMIREGTLSGTGREIKEDPNKMKTKPKVESNKLSMNHIIESLLVSLETLDLNSVDLLGLELLSKLPCLVLQIEFGDSIVQGAAGENSKDNNISDSNDTDSQRSTSDMSDSHSKCSMVFLNCISKLCISLSTTPNQSEQSDKNSSKYFSFLERTYVACLHWLQKFFQEGKEDNLINCNDAKHLVQSAGSVQKTVFQSLSNPFWDNGRRSVKVILGASGNLLNHLPMWSNGYPVGGIFCSSLCASLSACISYQLTESHSRNSRGNEDVETRKETARLRQEILNTCLSLVVVVGSKCATQKSYLSSLRLLSSSLLVFDKANHVKDHDESDPQEAGKNCNYFIWICRLVRKYIPDSDNLKYC